MDSVTIIRIIAGLFFLIVLIVALIPYWVIFKKAGFSPWLTVLMLVPLVNIVVLYVVAFSKWKVVVVLQPVPPSPFLPQV